MQAMSSRRKRGYPNSLFDEDEHSYERHLISFEFKLARNELVNGHNCAE